MTNIDGPSGNSDGPNVGKVTAGLAGMGCSGCGLLFFGPIVVISVVAFLAITFNLFA
ncbi:MAG: hypothetical protein ACTH32_06500 [Microbacterium gubbeenense]|uniref:hypothetical protein n=1 Tax=Microbacterium gubbeenense TaxID=159896 RepID=UPI003F9E40F9